MKRTFITILLIIASFALGWRCRPEPPPKPKLELMSPEKYIRKVQQRIIDSGYDKVKIDGVRKIVKVDGKWGPVSDKALCNIIANESRKGK